MTDRRMDIPIGCALNVAIIGKLSQTEEFKQICISLPIEYGIRPPYEGAAWPFFNLSWGAYMMYSVFVVSKELYNLPLDDSYFQNLVAKNAMKDFTIIKEKYSFAMNPKYHFSSFRNAISHVNFSIDDKNNTCFWDHPKGKKDQINWHWHIEISHDNFMKFLGIVNEENFRLYNEIKEETRNPNGTKN